MRNWKAIAGVCLVFVFGMIAGSLVTRAVLIRKVHALIHGGPDVARELIVGRMDRKLHLDGAQRAQLEEIIRKTQGEIKTIRQQVRPQIVQTLSDARESIRAILKPDQAKEFDQMVEKKKAMRLLKE